MGSWGAGFHRATWAVGRRKKEGGREREKKREGGLAGRCRIILQKNPRATQKKRSRITKSNVGGSKKRIRKKLGGIGVDFNRGVGWGGGGGLRGR